MGQVTFADYLDVNFGAKLWKLKNDMDVLEEKDFKDQVYLSNPRLKSSEYQVWNDLPVCEAQGFPIRAGDGTYWDLRAL